MDEREIELRKAQARANAAQQAAVRAQVVFDAHPKHEPGESRNATARRQRAKDNVEEKWEECSKAENALQRIKTPEASTPSGKVLRL